jgi:predicted peptidase
MKENLPIIFLLHGAGERGDGGDRLWMVDGIYGFSKNFPNKDYPCLIVMPQCPSASFWVAQIQNIKSFIEAVQQEYKADVKKTYLTGLSMGGFGTWFTSMAYPELFAAIAPICGGGMPWNAGILTMPVWAFHGALDEVVFPSETLDMVRSLKRSAKQEVKLTMFPNDGHNAWDSAYTDELFDWLLAQSL